MNTANKITIFRILLVPVFMLFISFDIMWCNTLALILFIIAALSDGVDGYVARKYNQITNFGKFIDPLADKLLVTAALIMLVEASKVSSWVAIIIISREFVVTGLRIVAAAEGNVISASWWGKIKTVTQIGAIIIAIFFNANFNFLGYTIDVHIMINACMWLAAIVTVVSGLDYIVQNKDAINVRK